MISSKFIVTCNRTVKNAYQIYTRKCATCPPYREAIVTIVDCGSKMGRNIALLLKQSPLISELRLYDKNSSIGVVAEDLSHIDTKTKVKSFCGTSVLKHAVMDADVVVTVGGCRSSPRETPKDLFEKNIDDVRLAALHLIEFNPKAVFCIAKPPVEALVPLVSEEYKKASVYDDRKIIGITSAVSMRANYYAAAASRQNTSEVLCPIIGGLSPNCVVAVLSQTKPSAGLTQPMFPQIQDDVLTCEEDILKLYGECGTICLSPAVGVSRFINILLRALKGDTNCVDCAFIRQTGHIGQFLPYMTSIVRLGRHGVMSSHMPKVNGDEAHRLKKASYVIKDLIHMGESVVTGKLILAKESLPKCKGLSK